MHRWLYTLIALAVVAGLAAAPALAQFGGGYRGSGTSSASGVDADGTAFVVESVPGTACTATGTDAVCMGDGAVAGDAVRWVARVEVAEVCG
mgnify:CR=1 FL=1